MKSSRIKEIIKEGMEQNGIDINAIKIKKVNHSDDNFTEISSIIITMNIINGVEIGKVKSIINELEDKYNFACLSIMLDI